MEKETDVEEKLLTSGQICRLLSFSRQTLHYYIKTGRLVPVGRKGRRGKIYLFQVKQLRQIVPNRYYQMVVQLLKQGGVIK